MEELIIISVCLFLNALLAAYEIAFVGTPKAVLRRRARDGDREAKRLLELRDRPERTLSIIQIGITLVAALSAAVGGAGAAENLEPYLIDRFGLRPVPAEVLAVLIVVIPLTYFTVVVGELVPKSLALRNSTRIALLGARWIAIADKLLAPIVSLLEKSTHLLLRLLPERAEQASETEAGVSVQIDSLSQQHQQAVLNCVQIENKRLREILVPWVSVSHISLTDRFDDIVALIFASGHTRLPVVGEDAAVTGVLHTKEFLALRETGATDWHSIVRPILRVRAEDSALATLRLMQAGKSHMAVVLSGSAEPLGVVTLEDITEEIWGEIYDEDDDSRLRKLFAERVKTRTFPVRR